MVQAWQYYYHLSAIAALIERLSLYEFSLVAELTDSCQSLIRAVKGDQVRVGSHLVAVAWTGHASCQSL